MRKNIFFFLFVRMMIVKNSRANVYGNQSNIKIIHAKVNDPFLNYSYSISFNNLSKCTLIKLIKFINLCLTSQKYNQLIALTKYRK